MSTTQSIANFYVDEEGIEQPIQYEAKDLVNKCAPEGYHWELDFRAYYQRLKIRDEYLASFTKDSDYSSYFPPAYPHWPTKYIAVKNKE